MRRDDITPEHQHMNLSNDPEEARMLVEAAPEAAMHSRRQRLTGSATGVGSVGFEESGAFDVGAGDHDRQDDPIVSKPSRTKRT